MTTVLSRPKLLLSNFLFRVQYNDGQTLVLRTEFLIQGIGHTPGLWMGEIPSNMEVSCEWCIQFRSSEEVAWRWQQHFISWRGSQTRCLKRFCNNLKSFISVQFRNLLPPQSNGKLLLNISREYEALWHFN